MSLGARWRAMEQAEENDIFSGGDKAAMERNEESGGEQQSKGGER